MPRGQNPTESDVCGRKRFEKRKRTRQVHDTSQPERCSGTVHPKIQTDTTEIWGVQIFTTAAKKLVQDRWTEVGMERGGAH